MSVRTSERLASKRRKRAVSETMTRRTSSSSVLPIDWPQRPGVYEEFVKLFESDATSMPYLPKRLQQDEKEEDAVDDEDSNNEKEEEESSTQPRVMPVLVAGLNAKKVGSVDQLGRDAGYGLGLGLVLVLIMCAAAWFFTFDKREGL